MYLIISGYLRNVFTLCTIESEIIDPFYRYKLYWNEQMKCSVNVGKTYFDGSVSPNFDICLSFCFIVCKRWYVAKK